MGLRYCHTLISRDKQYVPSAIAVRKFLAEVVNLGVVPEEPAYVLRTRSGNTREIINPFAGSVEVVNRKDLTSLESLDDFEAVVAGTRDYEVAAEGIGWPRLPPLAIEADSPYFVRVTCFVSSILRSTSDSHEEPEPGAIYRAAPYGNPCLSDNSPGLFCHPQTGQWIEVPDAGAARFWIEFELGKFMFPKIRGTSLDLLDPMIVVAAETKFGGQFVQGCHWG